MKGLDEQEALLAERTAAIQGSPVRSGGVKPQQIAGGVMLVLALVGGGIYLAAGNSQPALQGAQPESFTTQSNTGSASMTIGGFEQPQAAAPDPVIDAVARPDTVIETRDSEETLARLDELTAAQGEAGELIERLKVDLELANDQLVAAQEDLRIQESSFELERTAFATRLQNELTQQELRFGNQITELQAQLQIERSRQSGVDTTTDEQLARMQAAEQRRREQIESEALIFDNSSEDAPQRRY